MAETATDRGADARANEAAKVAGSAWDVANLLEQCVEGTMWLLARLARTFCWLLLRPRRLAAELASEDFSKSFCPPMAFLALGILCGYALLQDVWSISTETLEHLAESQTGWAAWIAQSVFDELRDLSLASILIRTMPTVIVTVLLAAGISRCLAGRTGAARLTAAICLVVGFRLFLRLFQAIWQLAMVRFSADGQQFFSSETRFQTILAVIVWAYLAAMVYILLFAGVWFLATVMRQVNRSWLRSWPVVWGASWGVSAAVFLGTFLLPTHLWNQRQVQKLAEECSLRVLALGPAQWDYGDERQAILATNVLIRNESKKQFLVALPRQLLFGQSGVPVDCNYEGEMILDGTCLLEAGTSRVVRATWRLTPAQAADAVQATAVPLIVQAGEVDDVLKDQVQNLTLQVALEAHALAALSKHADVRVATEAESPTPTMLR